MVSYPSRRGRAEGPWSKIHKFSAPTPHSQPPWALSWPFPPAQSASRTPTSSTAPGIGQCASHPDHREVSYKWDTPNSVHPNHEPALSLVPTSLLSKVTKGPIQKGGTHPVKSTDTVLEQQGKAGPSAYPASHRRDKYFQLWPETTRIPENQSSQRGPRGRRDQPAN